nr:hyoscyamine 6-dioxygenase-like [Tanacetum cinerariifolium]
MEKMVTKWCTTVKSVPQDYVFPEGIRPGDQVVPIGKNFQMIDLENTAASGDQKDVVQQIIQACQESGFFQ